MSNPPGLPRVINGYWSTSTTDSILMEIQIMDGTWKTCNIDTMWVCQTWTYTEFRQEIESVMRWGGRKVQVEAILARWGLGSQSDVDSGRYDSDFDSNSEMYGVFDRMSQRECHLDRFMVSIRAS